MRTLVGVVGCAALVAGCSSSSKTAATVPPTVTSSTAATSSTEAGVAVSSGILLTIATTGGLCEGGSCRATIMVDAQGNFTESSSTGATSSGTLAASLLAGIKAAVTADAGRTYAAGKSATGCESATDGRDVTYTLGTTTGTRTIAACTAVIPPTDPLPAAAAPVLNAAG